MNLFKQSFGLFKKNIVKIAFLDLSLIALILLLLALVRKILTAYMIKLNSFDINIENVGALLPEIKALALGYFFVYYFLTPVTIFLLWSFFQSIDYSFFEKKFSWKYLLKFTLVSVPMFVFIYLFLYLFLKTLILLTMPTVSTLAISPKLALVLLLITSITLTITSYLTLIIYSVLDNKLADAMKKAFKISYKKLAKLSGVFLVILLFSLSLIIVLFNLIIFIMTGFLSINYFIYNFFIVLLLILILYYLRTLFFFIVKS
jgi:hypothetical protein